MKYVFNIFAIFFFFGAGYAIWQDLTKITLPASAWQIMVFEQPWIVTVC